MRKMFIIIVILAIIFVGMVIYKNSATNNASSVTIEEINQIEEYISKIYMWKSVTKEALPTFENINEAEELWIWEVVKKNLEEYEVTYEQVQEKSKELFGENFKKEFPKEGNQSFEYNEEGKNYIATSIRLEAKKDSFIINEIQKTQKGYQVEIIEYIEDYSEEPIDEEASFNIIVRNIQDEEIRKSA